MRIFNSKPKEGTNLEMLRKVNEFYTHERSMTMVRYTYVDAPSNDVDLALLKEDDLRCCDICGAHLYESSIKRGESGSYSAIRQKKHMAFYNAAGQSQYTCYSVKRCLKRVDFDPDEDLTTPITGGGFDEFIDLLNIPAPEDVILYLSVKEDFEDKVKPFVDKWLVLELSKRNVGAFVSEYNRALKHLDFYDKKDRPMVERAIMSLVGVRNDR